MTRSYPYNTALPLSSDGDEWKDPKEAADAHERRTRL